MAFLPSGFFGGPAPRHTELAGGPSTQGPTSPLGALQNPMALMGLAGILGSGGNPQQMLQNTTGTMQMFHNMERQAASNTMRKKYLDIAQEREKRYQEQQEKRQEALERERDRQQKEAEQRRKFVADFMKTTGQGQQGEGQGKGDSGGMSRHKQALQAMMASGIPEYRDYALKQVVRGMAPKKKAAAQFRTFEHGGEDYAGYWDPNTRSFNPVMPAAEAQRGSGGPTLSQQADNESIKRAREAIEPFLGAPDLGIQMQMNPQLQQVWRTASQPLIGQPDPEQATFLRLPQQPNGGMGGAPYPTGTSPRHSDLAVSGGGMQAGGQAAQARQYTSEQEVREAYESGQFGQPGTPEAYQEAARILREQFGAQ